MAVRLAELGARVAPAAAAAAAALPAALCSRGACASCGACIGAGGSLAAVLLLRWLLRRRDAHRSRTFRRR